MAWLDVWGPALLASIVGVLAAAAFTWLFNWRADRDRKRGVRLLVWQELLHNDIALGMLVESLKRILEAASEGNVARVFVANNPMTPNWQRTRWDLPDVGTAFMPAELRKLSLWYLGLDGVTHIYEQLMDGIRRMDLRGRFMSGPELEHLLGLDAAVKDRIVQLVKYAEEVRRCRPPSPDKAFDIRLYAALVLDELEEADSSPSHKENVATQRN